MAEWSETDLAAFWVKQRAESWKTAPSPVELNETLRRLGRWRSRLLANTYIARHGARVLQGPFAGMEYVTASTEGALMPRLLGSYESELHPHLRRFAEEGVDTVVDVGCAEGYYAVGLARMIPGATIHAHDTDDDARAACRDLAQRNGVSDRVVVGGGLAPGDFQAFAGQRVLVMVDAEGAEDDLLAPDVSPALRGMRLIVETHDLIRPGVMARLCERFADSHQVIAVRQQLQSVALPDWLVELGHLDQLLAVWEWRTMATPWLVMTPKG